jgi:hypothetical protein
MEAMECNILDILPDKMPTRPTGRVIAWGALGIRGKKMIPALCGSPLEPDELWDIAGDGTIIKKPDSFSLGKEDLVLVLPINEASDAICSDLEGTGCAIIRSDDIVWYVSCLIFPQFYDGSVTFFPKEFDICNQK